MDSIRLTVRPDTTFGKVIAALCKRNNLNTEGMHLTINNREVQNSSTPQAHGVRHGGELSAQMVRRTLPTGDTEADPALGGNGAAASSSSSLARKGSGSATSAQPQGSVEPEDGKLIIQVQAAGKDNADPILMNFKMLPTSAFGKIMKIWAHHQESVLGRVRFLYEGHQLKPKATPQSLGWSQAGNDPLIVRAVPRNTKAPKAQQAKMSSQSSSGSELGSSSSSSSSQSQAAPSETADVREVLEEARGDNGITEDFPDEGCSGVAHEASRRKDAEPDVPMDMDGKEESSRATGGEQVSPDTACQAPGVVPTPASTEEKHAALVDQAAPAAPNGEQTSPGRPKGKGRGRRGVGGGQRGVRARQANNPNSNESPGLPLPSPFVLFAVSRSPDLLHCSRENKDDVLIAEWQALPQAERARFEEEASRFRASREKHSEQQQQQQQQQQKDESEAAVEGEQRAVEPVADKRDANNIQANGIAKTSTQTHDAGNAADGSPVAKRQRIASVGTHAGAEPTDGSKIQADKPADAPIKPEFLVAEGKGPKPAASAFDFFARVRRPVLLSELEHRLASEWKVLSDAERAPYEEFEAFEQRRFQAELVAMQLPH